MSRLTEIYIMFVSSPISLMRRLIRSTNYLDPILNSILQSMR